MKEILLTSSVLILALLTLRRVFRQKISRRVQYALWALVLVRLLAPVSLPALDFSVLTMAEPVQETISARLEAPAFTAPVVPVANLQPIPQNTSPAAAEPGLPSASPAAQSERTEAPAAGKELTLTEILRLAWLVGTAAMTVWLLVANLAFAAKLRRSRVPVQVSGCRRRVYLVESGLVSPCLFGVLRPAIYLTPAAMTSEESLRHVLAHEETHARHLDPLWSLLRGVCLAVYWFDPLVWIAASASKTDCELACDEGAIRRLGEEERLAYGRTLLSLIPIRRLPGNPLLSATTMSSDKKRLRDRITRIAENRQTRKLALCAMVLLTAGVCVLTFAGCAETAGKKGPDAAPTPVAEKQDGPLTAAELQYFNENFFNGDYLNIRNQFLSSMYDDPADINLYALFYCGAKRGSSASEEERAAYGFVDCDITKVSTAEADEVLLAYTGLTLQEANKASLEEGFTYLPEFDAYFNSHGDTNYRYHIDLIAGVRDGDLVRLYYNDTYYADGWKCVTLRETESGRYWFVSNRYCEKPVIPTVYPAGEPVLTVPLTDLTPYEPKAVEMTHHSDDCEERFVGYGQNWNVWGHSVQGYRSTDGKIYVAEITEAVAGREGMTVWEADCFLEMPNDQFSMDLYADLFGRDGFVLSYIGDVEGAYHAYYAFDEDGTLRLLCTVPGYGVDCRIMDLNGDGVNELLCTDSMHDARLTFQRDGRIYEADIAALLKEAWPEEERYMEFSSIAPYARFLSLWRFVEAEGDSGAAFHAMAFRSVYFDGGNLLVYKPDKTAVDHVTPGVTGPEDVMATLRQVVQEHRDERTQYESIKNAGIDDWRIVSLTGPWYEPFEGFTVEIYSYNYELHAAAPERVGLAGGMYVDEDGWVSPGYPDCDYIYFRVDADGSRTHLFHEMSNDMGPDSEWFHDVLENMLIQRGLLEPGPGLDVQAVWDEIKNDEALTLTLRTADRVGGGTYSNLGYNQPWDLTSDYTWEALTEDQVPDLSGTASLTVGVGANILTFYNPQLVSCSVDGVISWYRVTYTGPEDPFACEIYEWFRRWYDEAELNAMEAAIPVIPDDGRSREEIARTWAEAYEGAHLNVTGGSKFKCTYMDVRDVDVDYWDEVDITDLLTDYKESRGAQDVFLFNYSAVFVPEGNPHWFMAGNTVEYDGGDAPEGALRWWLMGYMYLMDDGWRCDGVGTGP